MHRLCATRDAQHTPAALVLTAPSERIAIANLAARQLLGQDLRARRRRGLRVVITLPQSTPPPGR